MLGAELRNCGAMAGTPSNPNERYRHFRVSGFHEKRMGVRFPLSAFRPKQSGSDGFVAGMIRPVRSGYSKPSFPFVAV